MRILPLPSRTDNHSIFLKGNMSGARFIFALFIIVLCGETTDAIFHATWEMLISQVCSSANETRQAEVNEKIVLLYYNGTTPQDFAVYRLENSTDMLLQNDFNTSWCTVVYFFGWTISPNSSITLDIVEAYKKVGNTNMIVVDWSSITVDNDYADSVALMEKASIGVARSLDALVEAGVNLCHVVGHSLGAQFAAMVARNMSESVRHLIGCDPAGPLFIPPVQCASHISSDDAECVEIIHTDMWVYGTPLKSGKVDHYPNSGLPMQPGCNSTQVTSISGFQNSTYCNHERSQSIWIQSLFHPTLFISRLCESYPLFKSGSCNRNLISYVGQCNNTSVNGKYYFWTSGEIPYGEGEKGSRNYTSL